MYKRTLSKCLVKYSQKDASILFFTARVLHVQMYDHYIWLWQRTSSFTLGNMGKNVYIPRCRIQSCITHLLPRTDVSEFIDALTIFPRRGAYDSELFISILAVITQLWVRIVNYLESSNSLSGFNKIQFFAVMQFLPIQGLEWVEILGGVIHCQIRWHDLKMTGFDTRGQFLTNPHYKCFWPCELDLWPMNLTHKLDLDNHPLNLHAEIQVHPSVHLCERDTHTHTDCAKTITPVASLMQGVIIGLMHALKSELVVHVWLIFHSCDLT